MPGPVRIVNFGLMIPLASTSMRRDIYGAFYVKSVTCSLDSFFLDMSAGGLMRLDCSYASLCGLGGAL